MSDALEKSKSINQKKINGNSKKKLIFRCLKENRKTDLQIFNDKSIVIIGPSSTSGLHIPSRLYNWTSLPQTKQEKSLYVFVDFIIHDTKEHIYFNNILCEIYHNGYGGYIRPKEKDTKVQQIFLHMNKGTIIKCLIHGNYKGQDQIQVNKQFSLAKELIDNINLSNYKQSKLLVYFNYRGKKVSIYKDNQNKIYVKLTSRIEDYGEARLSNYLSRFIKDWFKEEDFFLASKNGEQPIVVPSIIRERNTRGRVLNKTLNFPYWGNIEEIEILFSRPDLKLTSHTLKHYKIRELLQNTGFCIKGFLSNVWEKDNHKSKEFALRIKRTLEEINANENFTHFSEVFLEINPKFNVIKEATQHCFDGIIIDESKNQPILYLYEIISSFPSNRNTIIDSEIASLYHFKKQLGNNCRVLLFMNGELTSSRQNIITETYGINNGVILLGKDMLSKITENTHQFQNYITSYFEKADNLDCKSKKEEQAFIIIQSLANRGRLERSLISKYCYLMGIAINDFYLLYKEGLKKNNNLQAIYYVHQKLITSNQTAFLTTKPLLTVFRPFEKFLQRTIPANVRIGRIKQSNNNGTKYEQCIKQALEVEGYTVITNVVFYYLNRTFEIDLIALKGDKFILVSCKNNSKITHQWQAEEIIKTAANVLEFRKSLLNATNSFLYIKTNPTYRAKLKEKYHNRYWEERVKILLTD